MKKKIIFILIIVIIAFFAGVKISSDNKIKQSKMKEFNEEFDVYNKEISVNELITIINKAVNSNDNNRVEEDENHYYIENTTNSIKIEVKFLQSDEKFKMEKLYKNDLGKLAELYELQRFKCVNATYHKSTGYIKYLYFEELE